MTASETPENPASPARITLPGVIRRLFKSIQQPGQQADPARRRTSPDPDSGRGQQPGRQRPPGQPRPGASPVDQAWYTSAFGDRVAPNLKPAHAHGHEPLIGLSAHTGIPAPVGQRVRRSIPQDVKIAVSARDGGRCRQCGSTHQLHFDHVIPVSRGGANTVANIQLLCGSCNRSKSAKPKG